MPVFLFTDIEGSTRLWEDHTAEMGAAIARHDALLREQVHASGGRITKHTGDGITAAFEAGEPLTCALETQLRFAREDWGAIGELCIRVGLNAGAAEWIAEAPTAAYRLTRAALSRMKEEEPELAATFHEFVAHLFSERLTATTRTLEAVLR